MKYCPCGTQKRYLECCGAYLEDKALPPTPETLMRSRYTAFVEKKADYLNKTMTIPPFEKKAIEKGKGEWLGLEVIQAYPHSTNSNIGYVEFIAKHTQPNNKVATIHELSEFHFIVDRWYYVSGIQKF